VGMPYVFPVRRRISFCVCVCNCCRPLYLDPNMRFSGFSYGLFAVRFRFPSECFDFAYVASSVSPSSKVTFV
jgi:hypothetical protein